MRQVGVLAAPCLVALQDAIPRLQRDHRVARQLAGTRPQVARQLAGTRPHSGTTAGRFAAGLHASLQVRATLWSRTCQLGGVQAVLPWTSTPGTNVCLGGLSLPLAWLLNETGFMVGNLGCTCPVWAPLCRRSEHAGGAARGHGDSTRPTL